MMRSFGRNIAGTFPFVFARGAHSGGGLRVGTSDRKRKSLTIRQARFVCAALCSLISVHVSATPSSPGPSELRESSPWVVQVTPYVWTTGLQGNVSPFERGPALPVDKSFSQVLSDLNGAVFVNVWARHERLVLSGDLMYVNTAAGGGTGPLPAIPVPALGKVTPAEAEIRGRVHTKQFMSTVQAGFRVVETPELTLDTLAGARFWHVSNDASVELDAPSLGSPKFRIKETFHWVDPLVGLRLFVRLGQRLSMQAHADIGGFGAGADSTWSAQATVNYAFSDKFSASAGYKVMKVDYARGGNVYDVRLSGPVIGVTYKF